MKKTITFLFLTFSVVAYSQSIDYKNASTTPGSNYYDIVNQVKQKTSLNKNVSEKPSLSEVKAKKHFERWAYFWRNRVNSDGSFPSALQGWENAGLLDNNVTTTKSKNALSKGNDALSWTNIGPQTNPLENGYIGQPQLGRINTFWRYTSNPATGTANDILIVGTPTGGIWKSTDNGATWSPKFDDFAGIGITDIKGSSSDPAIPGVLYATTGDWDSPGTLNGIGVYKSTDYGDTWIATSLSGDLSDTSANSSKLGHLVVYDNLTAVVAAKNDILKTTDGGTTWVSKFYIYDGRFGRMASFGNTIVCTDTWGGVYFSLNNGDTWETLTPLSGFNKKAVAVDKEGANAGTFYTQPSDGQLYILDLAAKTETAIGTVRTAGAYDSQYGYNQTLTIRGGMFLEGSVNGQTSLDNGNTWYKALNGYWNSASDPGVYVHSDHHQMGYLNSGLSFWDAHDGGLSFIEFSSIAQQIPTVTYKSEGVINTQVYTISINPTVATSDDFIMANQDNDAFSKEGGQWVSVSAGDGVCSAIDYNNPAIRYVGGTEGSLTRSYETLGYTGGYGGDEVPKPATAEFVWPFSLDTANPTIAFGGFDDMYKSTNISTISLYPTTPEASAIWTDLNAGVGNPISFDNQGNNIAVVGKTGLSKSADGGSTWSTINQPSGAEINSFSIDGTSTNGNTLYATAKSYVAGKKVFKSVDGGLNWTNISGNMPNIIMNKILLKQNQSPEHLFVGTELGVYFSTDGGTTWDKLGANLPNVIVNDLKINYLANKLFVGTYGRGMWSIDISNLTLKLEKLEANDALTPKLYPNPVSNGNLNIQLPNSSELFDYVIYNVVGGLIKKGKLDFGNNSINVVNATPGIYIVRMTSNNYVFSQKIIIK